MVAEARQSPGAADGLLTVPTVSWRQCGEVAVVSAVALALALTLPLATTVFALLLFGVLHNYFELRYLVGRFGGLFTGSLVEAVLVGLTAIVLIRLVPLGPLGRPAEIVATYALLGVVLVVRLGTRPHLLIPAALILVLAAALSLAYSEY